MLKLPSHLKKYIVDQEYSRYSPVDQAVWRFILRQLKSFLSTHAHPFYVEGLEKTGIEIDHIPKISEISEKLERFGWRALPVSGFIPPAAFMELQSLGVLPIASNMRVITHLMYTPAPDIVHEAAGHAPMLAHPGFADYLRQYATIARKSIVSKEDINIYEAIRSLSDLKENTAATPLEIERAQKHLDHLSKSTSHVSEAAQLSRMNWWTAEYGLIGKMEDPKIFGAGLLSSVGEAKWCLSNKVKKIPLSVACTEQSYDITEPQPQLFVTSSFDHLVSVLKDFSETMSFKRGGLSGIKRAVAAETVNTAELNSGFQISGVFSRALDENGQIIFLKTLGPTQLGLKDKELPSHGKLVHSNGFSTPIGTWADFPDRCPSSLTDHEIAKIGVAVGQDTLLKFKSGFEVKGHIERISRVDGVLTLITWSKCTVTRGQDRFFEPDWGIFDMAIGKDVASVFGGPADREAYGELDDFVATRVPQKQPNESEQALHKNYQTLRLLRDSKPTKEQVSQALTSLLKGHSSRFPTDWLLLIEAYELSKSFNLNDLALTYRIQLDELATNAPETQILIQDGLALEPVS